MTINLTISQEKQIQKNADNVFNEITFAWKKSTETLLAIAKKLHEYENKSKESLEGKLFWKILREKLSAWGLNEGTNYKLRQIGAKEILHDPKLLEYLPPSYNKLYSLVEVTDKEIKDGIKKKEINPQISFETLKRLSNNNSTKELTITKTETESSELKTVIQIQMSDSYVAHNLDAINEKFIALQAELFKGRKTNIKVERKGFETTNKIHV
jgi:hypothetical protein